MTDSGFTTRELVYIGIGVVGLYVIYKVVTSKLITESLNPMSNKNIASRAADAVTETVTGEKGATIGNKIYDWLNPASSVKIEVFFANGDVRLANGQILRKGWKVSADGTLTDASGKVLGKAS